MRKLVGLFGGVFPVLCVISVLVSARPRTVRPMRQWEPSSLPQQGVQSSPWRPTPAPSRPQVAKGETGRGPDGSNVRLTCHPDYIEIEMDADLLSLGIPVNVEDVRLGTSEQTGAACRALPSEPGKYTIAAYLTDCGTEHVITDDYLIYTNRLEYSPGPSPDGLIRTQEASFPIECRYRRRYDLSSIPVMPTWMPYMSTRADEGTLDFSLRLMTDDWAFPRATKTYYLGETIHIEASVTQFNHNPMRVFADDCVATLSPDPTSVPRYAFIEQGCLMDSYMTDSASRFLPRQQHDKLQFQLDAFRFHQEEKAEMYITCMLRAEPVGMSDGMCRACTFMDNRWQSADNEDQFCGVCLNGGPGQSPLSNQKSPPTIQNSVGSHGSSSSSSSSRGNTHFAYLRPGAERPSYKSREPSEGLEKEERIGPISVLPKSARMMASPPAIRSFPQHEPETERAETEQYSLKRYPIELDNAETEIGQPETELDKPETEVIRSFRPRMEQFSPSGHAHELDKMDSKPPQTGDKASSKGNLYRVLDLLRRQASDAEMEELMMMLWNDSLPLMTKAEISTEAPTPVMAEVSSPLVEKKTTPPLPAIHDEESLLAFKDSVQTDLKRVAAALETLSSTSALSKEAVMTTGDKTEDGIKR